MRFVDTNILLYAISAHPGETAKDRWQITYWDTAIIKAARSQACETVLSEDLQHGQNFGGVPIVNPFV